MSDRGSWEAGSEEDSMMKEFKAFRFLQLKMQVQAAWIDSHYSFSIYPMRNQRLWVVQRLHLFQIHAFHREEVNDDQEGLHDHFWQ